MANNNLSSKLGMNYTNLHNNYLEADLVGIGSYYVSGGVRHSSLGQPGMSSRQVSDSGNSTNSVGNSNNAKLIFNQQQLSRAWDVSQRSTGKFLMSIMHLLLAVEVLCILISLKLVLI